VRASLKVEDMHSPLVSMVSQILKQGVQAGTFRKGVDPVHLYISIAGLSYFFFSNTRPCRRSSARTSPPPRRGEPAASTWSTW